MSDSGRQIGDCRHGNRPEWCPTCLRARLAAAEAEVARVRAAVYAEVAGRAHRLGEHYRGKAEDAGLPQAERDFYAAKHYALNDFAGVLGLEVIQMRAALAPPPDRPWTPQEILRNEG